MIYAKQQKSSSLIIIIFYVLLFTPHCHGAEEQTCRHIKLKGHKGPITKILFSSNGDKIVTGSTGNKNNLMVWDSNNGDRLFNCVGHPGSISDIKISCDNYLISGSDTPSNNLNVWDINKGSYKSTLIHHKDGITSIDCHPNGLIASSSSGITSNLCVWDLKTETGFRLVTKKDKKTEQLPSKKKLINHVQFTPDGNSIISCSQQPLTICLWSITRKKGTLLKKIEYPGSYTNLAFNAQATQCATTAVNPLHKPQRSVLVVHDILTDTHHNRTRIFSGHTTHITSAQFSKSGKWIISTATGTAKNLIVWNNDKRAMNHTVKTFTDISTATLSPDEKYIALSRFEEMPKKEIFIWDIETRTIKHQLAVHKQPVSVICFNEDGTKMVSGGKETTYIYNDDTVIEQEHSGELILWFLDKE